MQPHIYVDLEGAIRIALGVFTLAKRFDDEGEVEESEEEDI